MGSDYIGKFKCVQRMLRELDLLSRSDKTKKTYLQGLKYFMKAFEIDDLDRFVQEIKSGKISADEVYKEWIITLNSSGFAPKSINAWRSALRKLFEANDIEIKKRIAMKVYTINESVLPSKEELRKVLEVCDLRARTIILILASSGLRPSELIELRLKDIDLDKDPAVIRVRGLTAKERKPRITFMSDEAKTSLKLYLEKRKQMGHELNPDSPVIATDGGNKMSYGNLYLILSNAFKLISKKEGKRYVLHPHVLRKWFKTQLIASGIPGPIADRLCGHSRYLANEYELYTENILREWYLKAMPNLRILSRPIDEERVRKEVTLETIRKFAKTIGIDPSRVKIEREREFGRELTLDEEIEALQEEIQKFRNRISSTTPNGSKKYEARIITEEEIVKFIEDGWEIVKELSNGKIVVRRVSS